MTALGVSGHRRGNETYTPNRERRTDRRGKAELRLWLGVHIGRDRIT